MRSKVRRSGFTLIEVLIVVVIMAILAATILPQFGNATKDAKETSLKFNINLMRSQIDLYKIHHAGAVPDGTNNLEQLIKSTNAAGVIGAAGPNFPYGPYVQKVMPAQQMSGLNTVRLDTGTGLPSATAAPGGGWIYRPATGEVWVDHPDYLAY